MSNYCRQDTIAAIATPIGEGGVAIIRISGPDAIIIADKIFSGSVPSYKSHTTHYGTIYSEEGVIDAVLVLVMREPRSYTGETTVEIHCHGGLLVSRRVLEETVRAGARHAQPGEFTYRAYINGKLDLAQAEAVQALIGAKNTRSLEAARDQLSGRLSVQVQQFQRELVDVAAILEAWVDFPEEGLEFTSFEELRERLQRVIASMQRLVDSFHHGRLVQEGIALCLVGAPNVGKSSLMNALLDRERAIVTEIPGTTRDLLEEELRLGRLHFRLIDTAGQRQATDSIEQEGIRRAEQAMAQADLIVHVLDASAPTISPLSFPAKTVVVWNKIDLSPAPSSPVGVEISVQRRQGLEALQAAIERKIEQTGVPEQDEFLLTNGRHKEALEAAVVAANRVVLGLQGEVSPEFLCIEVREALTMLGRIVGQDVTEEVLSAIFSKFCLGK